MTPEALVSTGDSELECVARRAFEELGIVTHSAPHSRAIQLVKRSKFDAVLLHCDGSMSSLAVLDATRKSASNRSAVIFAVAPGNAPISEIYEAGANFVVTGDSFAEDLPRSLRSAHGMILRERRRYHRFPLWDKAVLGQGDNLTECVIENLSEGGVCITDHPSPALGKVELRFELPGAGRSVEVTGNCTWVKPESGKMGVRFTAMVTDSKEALEHWIRDQFRSPRPASDKKPS